MSVLKSHVTCIFSVLLNAYILFHVGENVLEGWSGVRTELPTSLNDASQTIAREKGERLKTAITNPPNDTLSSCIPKWLSN